MSSADGPNRGETNIKDLFFFFAIKIAGFPTKHPPDAKEKEKKNKKMKKKKKKRKDEEEKMIVKATLKSYFSIFEILVGLFFARFVPVVCFVACFFTTPTAPRCQQMAKKRTGGIKIIAKRKSKGKQNNRIKRTARPPLIEIGQCIFFLFIGKTKEKLCMEIAHPGIAAYGHSQCACTENDNSKKEINKKNE